MQGASQKLVKSFGLQILPQDVSHPMKRDIKQLICIQGIRFYLSSNTFLLCTTNFNREIYIYIYIILYIWCISYYNRVEREEAHSRQLPDATERAEPQENGIGWAWIIDPKVYKHTYTLMTVVMPEANVVI